MTNSSPQESAPTPAEQPVVVEYSDSLLTIDYAHPDGTEALPDTIVNDSRVTHMELLTKLNILLGPGTHSVAAVEAASGLTHQARGAAIRGLHKLLPDIILSAAAGEKVDYLTLGDFSVSMRIPQSEDYLEMKARADAVYEAKLQAKDDKLPNFKDADHAVVISDEQTWIMPLDTPEGIMAARVVRAITQSKNGAKLSIPEIRAQLFAEMPRAEQRLCARVDIAEVVKGVGEQITVKNRPITTRAYLSSRIQEFNFTGDILMELVAEPQTYEGVTAFVPNAPPTPTEEWTQFFGAYKQNDRSSEPVIVAPANVITLSAERLLPTVDMIPAVMDNLTRLSVHGDEAFIPDYNVADELEFINETPDGPHTPNQIQLLDDLKRLAQYSDTPVYELRFMKPGELHGLVQKLDLLSAKNRPDFDTVEAQLLDFFRNKSYSAGVSGQIDRADNDAPNRRGMTWDKMVSLANTANYQMRSRYRSSQMLSEYAITTRDPQPATTPDLSAVYQFVTNIHAMEIYNTRAQEIALANIDAFEANCKIINEWHETTATTLNNLPTAVKVGRLSASWTINNLIETMNERLVSDQRTGKLKAYTADPTGALSLQLRIAHSIDELREVLVTGGVTSEEEIIPLV
jgi:hypothetical protein